MKCIENYFKNIPLNFLVMGFVTGASMVYLGDASHNESFENVGYYVLAIDSLASVGYVGKKVFEKYLKKS